MTHLPLKAWSPNERTVRKNPFHICRVWPVHVSVRKVYIWVLDPIGLLSQCCMPVTKNKDQLSDQCAMLVNRVRKNMRRLKGWRRSHEISCYRLYDRDIPEIPLCVDWYEGRLYIADVRRRVDDSDDLEPVVHWGAALADALSVTDEHCYLKQRRRQRGRQQYQRLDEQLTRFAVTEGGLKFLVNLSDYLDTDFS